MLRRGTLLMFCLGLLLNGCGSDDVTGSSDDTPPVEGPDVILSDVVRVNPGSYAPLSARIDLSTASDVSISLRVHGKNGEESDIIREFPDMGTDFSIPVHGLYANTENTVTLNFEDDSGTSLGSKDYTIQTGPLLADLPQIVIKEADRQAMAEGFTLVSYFGHNGTAFPQRPFIFDSFGDIRWYLDFRGHPDLNGLFYDDGMERLANGNFYFGSGGTAFGGDASNSIYEVDLFGAVQNTWEMPGYEFHHEVHEKPNGNFLVTVNKIGAPTIEDHIIEIDRESKQIIKVWDLGVSLEKTRTTWTTDSQDWFHANAVVYDETDDTIIVSGRTQGVVKLTASNEVVWIMAPHKDWGSAGNGKDLNQFLLTPLDKDGTPISSQAVLDGDSNHPDFEWNWYQHAPLVMPNGDIMLFDNGDSRNYSSNERYSRAVVYRVNPTDMTIQQIWQYGKELGEEAYSRIVSDVDYLPQKDHMLYSPGAIIFDGSIFGKSMEIDMSNNEVIFEADIIPPIAFFNIITLHRTERLPLYPD
ncbi:aryl-sulfate sulfotransferase [Poritiphilus flavus]|uniref:Arylsulfotransferase N-terminal domain-containing protein n=1 Tax=Poritiphilus flavus TaxID=2697053 RepID=A0A6L9EDV2_9FLAO|nr:aryl-sulfate sulfotransferase [Poritiphilus flavus]NAS12821.1 hypothetical protein [Poritiphilus flavus]